MEKGLYKEKTEKTKKNGKKYRKKILLHSHTVSQEGNVGPSVHEVGGPERQIANLRVLVAAMRLEMELGHPSQDAGVTVENTASPIWPNKTFEMP